MGQCWGCGGKSEALLDNAPRIVKREKVCNDPASAGTETTTGGSSSIASTRRPRRNMTCVAAGHGGSSLLKDFAQDQDFESGIPEFVIKAYDKHEAENYLEMERLSDPILSFSARYHGEVDKSEMPDDVQDAEERYMRLTNLLKGFKRAPNVMDCKIGVRSFSENEVHNKKLRPDLLERMLKLDPSAATQQEREAGGCTKHRWMMFNDKLTNLAGLGFRVDGIVKNAGEAAPKSELKQATTIVKCAQCIVKHFLPCFSATAERPESDARDATLFLQRNVAESILADLRRLDEALKSSGFARNHSFVGCSLLFVADLEGPNAGVFLIDFAKVQPVPKELSVDHFSPWVQGNFEDGLFTGVANLIQCWEEVREMVLAEQNKEF